MESWKHFVKGENEIRNKNSKKKSKVKQKNLSVRVTLEGPKYFFKNFFSTEKINFGITRTKYKFP